MPTQFHVESIGDSHDDGPAGECGIRVSARDGDFHTHLLLHCAGVHPHGPACAQSLLDAEIMSDGVTLSEKEVEEEVEKVDEETKEKVKGKVKKMVEVRTPNPNISPRVVMERHLAAKRAEVEKVASEKSRHAVESSTDNRLS